MKTLNTSVAAFALMAILSGAVMAEEIPPTDGPLTELPEGDGPGPIEPIPPCNGDKCDEPIPTPPPCNGDECDEPKPGPTPPPSSSNGSTSISGSEINITSKVSGSKIYATSGTGEGGATNIGNVNIAKGTKIHGSKINVTSEVSGNSEIYAEGGIKAGKVNVGTLNLQ